MALTKKKSPTPPTIEEKLNAANATAAAALSVFELAAKDLDEAKAQADDIVFLVTEEIDRLAAVREAAITSSDAHGASAAKIRSLVA